MSFKSMLAINLRPAPEKERSLKCTQRDVQFVRVKACYVI